MAAMEEKCSSNSLNCLDDCKDNTFYETWFTSQFPIKCLTQIIMIEDVLKTEQAQTVLMRRFQGHMYSTIYTWPSGSVILQELLSRHFTKDIVMQLYGNVVTDTYNILNFKSSRIMKCLKIAKEEVPESNPCNKIADQIIDKEVLNKWFHNMLFEK